MLRRLLRIAAGTFVAIAALAVVFVVAVLIRSRRTFDAPYPNVTASKDPAVIERGRYLAYGASHCVNCHTSNADDEAVKRGEQLPLAGGRPFHLPFGTIYSPNLTPDRETGIGRYSDGQLARILRHGVMADGRATLPFMEMQNVSDEDLTAIISFLRSQPPVRREVPKNDINFVGKAVTAFLLEPIGPSGPVLKTTPEPGSAEHGEYLATAVANCESCHTKRNMLTGRYDAPLFSGGLSFDLDKEHVLVTPNLTPARAGRITSWSEEQFVGRFGAGVGLRGTHMPWRQYQTMTESDVRSIYRYLRTLEPVEKDPGPSVQLRAEAKARQKDGKS